MLRDELVAELCDLCCGLLEIVKKQDDALEQLGAVTQEEERAAAEDRLKTLLG